jgi:PQQ-dependent catabolism-associated CXXCW motif protein
MKPAALLAALAFGALPAMAGVPEPDGYRGEPYQAEVPDTLAGAEVIGDAAAHALWLAGTVGFIDALPRAPKPELPAGTVWHEAPHESIPGALWLPNTGYAELAPETLDYLRAGLEAVTQGDPAAPVVVFCKRDCWMSWNAARRAVALGYARVFWYPAGVDGWRESGWSVETTQPFQPGG